MLWVMKCVSLSADYFLILGTVTENSLIATLRFVLSLHAGFRTKTQYGNNLSLYIFNRIFEPDYQLFHLKLVLEARNNYPLH